MREYAEVLLHGDERLHRQLLGVHLAAAARMIDAHHVAIARTVLIALHAAIRTAVAVGNDAPAEIRARLHFDLGRVRQTLGGVREDCAKIICEDG